MNKVYPGKQIDSVYNNVFLSRCNTSEVLVKLGLRKKILKEVEDVKVLEVFPSKPNNIFLSRYDTKTALSMLRGNEKKSR